MNIEKRQDKSEAKVEWLMYKHVRQCVRFINNIFYNSQICLPNMSQHVKIKRSPLFVLKVMLQQFEHMNMYLII